MTRPHYNANRIKYTASWYDHDLNPCDKEHGVYYFRSKLELKCANYLNLLKKCGKLDGWRAGKSWDFNLRREQPYRANSQYTPDFEILDEFDLCHNLCFSPNDIGRYAPKPDKFWVEVKGSPQGIIKIERALKHFPERRLMVFDKDGMQPAQTYLDKIHWRKRKKKYA